MQSRTALRDLHGALPNGTTCRDHGVGELPHVLPQTWFLSHPCHRFAVDLRANFLLSSKQVKS